MSFNDDVWDKNIISLTSFLKEGNMKQFYATLNTITKIKIGNPPVKGII